MASAMIPQDEAYKWVIEQISKLSSWNDREISLPPDLGKGILGQDYRRRVRNILHFLQDEQHLIEIIEEPALVLPADWKQPTLAEIFLSDKVAQDPTTVSYLIRVAKNYDDVFNDIYAKDYEAKLYLESNHICIDIEGHVMEIKTFRTDSFPLKIFRELLLSPGVLRSWKNVILAADANEYGETADEYIRRNLNLKPVTVRNKFFPVKSKREVQFVQKAIISPQEYRELIEKYEISDPQ